MLKSIRIGLNKGNLTLLVRNPGSASGRQVYLNLNNCKRNLMKENFWLQKKKKKRTHFSDYDHW